MEQNKQEKGLVKREEFGVVETQRTAETAATSMAARQQAMVGAMCRLAELHPRNEDRALAGILRDCERPGFAGSLEDPVAMYNRKAGKEFNKATGRWEDVWVQGASIRLAESMLRHWRNVHISVDTVFDGDDLRICHVAVMDLQNNIHYATDVNVPKRVEKLGFGKNEEPPKGREVLSSRINSEGKRTYLVNATDGEIIMLQNNLISKAIRNNGLRLLPRDVIELALEQIRATQAKEDAKDPDAGRRNVVLQFSKIGVDADMIGEYLNHPIEQTSPAELADLRRVYTLIKQGDSSWGEIMDERGPEGSADEQEQKMAEQLAKLRAKETPKKPEPKAEEKQPEPTESDEDRAGREALEAQRAKYETPKPRRQLNL